ncbi:ATP-binding protein [Clostridium hydrogeniformans]|uniref:ATP-binding protein n=1 Tax=Clostridium hydrogeniformans TaxID=349933 RepID=UPI000482D449|nr:AAA family ATPase [Clostridium hydrogeniformans]
MRIKSLNIGAFGKIKNKKIDLDPGFNIIYGENEKGKSTIQGFIRVILYGMTLNKKNLKDNDRKRFYPWTGEKPYGEMAIIHQDEEIIIKRTFGTTKREDTTDIINSITGEKIQIDKIQPGKNLIGLSIGGFIKTLFIKQLGSEITKEKEEEIMHKLSSLETLSHDDVSYDKAIGILEDYKKLWSTQRKGGKLRELYENIESLNDEYKEAILLTEANLNDSLKLNSLKEGKSLILKDIKALELYRKHMKKIKLNSEYKEIIKYLRKTKELKSLKERFNEGIHGEDNLLTEEFMDDLWKEYYAMKELSPIIKEYDDEIQDLNLRKEEYKEELEGFPGFSSLEEDAYKKVLKLLEERSHLKDRYNKYKEIEEDVINIENNIEKINKTIEEIKEIEPLRNRIEETFSEYEEKLKELKFFLNNNPIDYELLKKEALIKEEIKSRTIIVALSVSLIFGGVLSLILFSKPVGVIILLVGLILLGYFLKEKNSLSIYEGRLIEEKKKQERLHIINEDIKEIEEELKDISNRLSVKEYREIYILLKKYDDFLVKKSRLKEILQDKLILLNDYDVQEEINKNNKFLEFILNHTSCASEEEFFKSYEKFNFFYKNYEEVDKEIKEKNSYLNSLKETFNKKSESLQLKLESLNKAHIPLENIEEEIKDLSEKLKMKRSLEIELNQVESSYKLLLKDRDIEGIKNEIEDIAEEEAMSFDFNNEEELEDTYKRKNLELLNIEKELKDVENSINNRFLNKRDTWKIMQDIEFVKEEIGKGEEFLEVLDLALENLKESFKEVQKTFGPILNSKVSNIFNSVTLGSYNEVKVGEDYSMITRDKELSTLVSKDSLSSGTEDQLYFSLRLALVDMLFSREEMVPIILDEAFIQYDDLRLKNTLKVLYEYSSYKQIILFTCQKREIELIKEIGEAKIIDI